MLKESKNKIIAVFQQNIDALKKEIKGIDEKYKKLADEEKAELKEMLEYYKTQRDLLNDKKNFVIVPTEEPVAEQPQPAEEDEVVTDNIFPENNEEETSETAEEVPVEEFTEASQNSEVSEDVVEEAAEESTVDTDAGWPEFPEEWNS